MNDDITSHVHAYISQDNKMHVLTVHYNEHSCIYQWQDTAISIQSVIKLHFLSQRISL